MDHRTIGYSFLSGSGIELGALHNPAKVPAYCEVRYCDAMTAAQARVSFPELADAALVTVDHLVNLDTDCLQNFASESQDFVILNHVIEHVANPVRVLLDCCRVLRKGGKLVLSAPDMRYTFDHQRALTSIEHLWTEFEQGVTEVTDEHYRDFLASVHPEVMDNPERLAAALLAVRERREHVHVWTSESFEDFCVAVLQRGPVQALPLLLCSGIETASEFFSVWQIGGTDAQAVASDVIYPACALAGARYLAGELRTLKQQNAGELARLTTESQASQSRVAELGRLHHQAVAALQASEHERERLFALLTATEQAHAQILEGQRVAALAHTRILEALDLAAREHAQTADALRTSELRAAALEVSLQHSREQLAADAARSANQVQVLNQQIAEQASVVNSQASLLAAQTDQIEDKDRHIRNVESLLGLAQQEKRRLLEAKALMEFSRSWRLTKPLRWISKRLSL